MRGQRGVQQASTVGDLENGVSGAAEVLGGHGVQEESPAHGEEIPGEDHGAGAEATAGAGAGHREVGGVRSQGDPQVQELFVESVERSLREISLSTWQSAIRTFLSGDD